jgi:hypothetical protein
VPDALGDIEYRDCCDQHDLDWAVGGVRGGIIPWRVDGRWQWRFMRSNVGLSRCMRDRFAAQGQPALGWVAGPLYWAAVSTVGVFAWRWRSPTGGVMPTHEQLAALACDDGRRVA